MTDSSFPSLQPQPQPNLPLEPIWRASARMAVITAAGVAASVIMASGLAGCAYSGGIAPQASLRDAASLGLTSGSANNANIASNAGRASTGVGTSTPEVSADWWQDFGDAQLNQLVADALASSPNLKLAQARLARAQAVSEVTGAIGQPQLNAQLDATRQRYTANGAVPPPLAGSVLNSGLAQLSASWELDFFGKNRAALDAALGTAQAAVADAQAARTLLASSVTRAYFGLLRLHEQLQVAQRTLAQRTEALRLVQDRVRAGLDTRLEQLTSEGGLPEARLQAESLQEQIALSQNALAALVGKPVSEPNKPLVTVFIAQSAIKNIVIAPVIPADLLGRRADVAAARWRVEASSQDVANAKAQFYPNINLVAFAGFSSIGLNRLLNAGSQQWGVGPALRLPIFDAGRLRANLRFKTADLDAAVESYNAAVIDAVRDVADQVTSQQAISRQQTEQRAAQGATEGAYAIALQRYNAGLGNYLQVLTAETNVLAQRRTAVDLAGRALDTQVGLIRALGGGYAPPSVPAPALAAQAAPGSANGFQTQLVSATK